MIGSDGMRKEQYTEPYVWPVASATVTSMRVMAKYGYTNRNARKFAVVYDSKYKFGTEDAQAPADGWARSKYAASCPGKGLRPSTGMFSTGPIARAVGAEGCCDALSDDKKPAG